MSGMMSPDGLEKAITRTLEARDERWRQVVGSLGGGIDERISIEKTFRRRVICVCLRHSPSLLVSKSLAGNPAAAKN